MAGSIGKMAKVYKKNFTYVPPTPPAELIDCNNFILDFTGRKFLNVGLDPTDEFNTVVQIITPSRYINMPADFLRRIFSLMGNILSFILDQPQKYKRNLFLETEIISLSSMVYQGENMLVIESKTQAGCRVLLNRSDLMKLQYLEWSVVETVVRMSTIIRPLVLKQFEIIGNYLDQEFTKVDSPPKTPEEMFVFIKNLSDYKIIESKPKHDMNFISQLKMFATKQLADQWVQRWSGENSPELFTESEMRLISPLSPPKYSDMSPMYDDFDPSQAQAADEERAINEYLRQINTTQATWAPTKSLPNDVTDGLASPQYIESLPTNPAVDENDGPMAFNHSPSILGFTGGKPTKKRNAKRKLFD